MEGADFIGRKALITRILGGKPGSGALYELRGITGAGKSALLMEVQRQVTAVGDIVMRIPVEGYFSTLDLAPSSTGEIDLDGELQRFGTIALAVVESLSQNQDTDIRDAMAEIRRRLGGSVAGGAVSGRGGYGGEGFHQHAALDERIKHLIRLAQDAVNRLVEARTAEHKRVFLLVDTFEVVRRRPLGLWLIDLFRGLRQVVVVVAQQQVTRDQDSLPGATATLEVTGLTPDEVLSVLTGELGSPLGEQLATAVSGFTDGHALAVGLVADLAKERLRTGEQADADDLLELIRQLSAGGPDPDTRLSKLVGNILASVEEQDAPVRKGLDCLWAVRRFDVDLLQRLLSIDATPQTANPELVRRLLDYSFVEKRNTPGQADQVYYVIHQFIRQQGLNNLKSDPERLQALHRSAEAYYQTKTRGHFTDYNSWFIYESSAWQILVREWLYHVANLNEAGQHSARLGLAGLFMDAFWWYGSYAPFPFCEELLADWNEMTSVRPNKELDLLWGTTLRRIYELYPKGWRKDSADWRTIRQLLLRLRSLAGLDNEQDLDDARVRRLRAQVDYYLSHANRRIDPHDPTVDELLQDAKKQLTANGDRFANPWMSVHRANAALARDEPQAALEAVSDAVACVRTTEDWELAANVHRVYADAAWARGARQLALDCLARATLNAYRFQVKKGSSRGAAHISRYGQMFLSEMHERMAERMAVLVDTGELDAARDACLRIRAFFGPYWNLAPDSSQQDPLVLLAERGAQAAVGGILPPPPADSDLNRFDTPYLLLAADVVDQMQRSGALDAMPGTPLPRQREDQQARPGTTDDSLQPRQWWRPRRQG